MKTGAWSKRLRDLRSFASESRGTGNELFPPRTITVVRTIARYGAGGTVASDSAGRTNASDSAGGTVVASYGTGGTIASDGAGGWVVHDKAPNAFFFAVYIYI